MVVSAGTLISMGGHLPPRPPNPEAEIGFVPFGRYERFVEQPDGVEALTAHGPRADDQIDLL